jgi:hypothetical protein
MVVDVVAADAMIGWPKTETAAIPPMKSAERTRMPALNPGRG